jgi:Family of unknown function (DUF6174)
MCFFCTDAEKPVTIQVRNGSAVSIRYALDGNPVTNGVFRNVDTIDKLFSQLKAAYNRESIPEDLRGKLVFDVTYDADKGYPITSFIDDEYWLDDQVKFQVSNLIPR